MLLFHHNRSDSPRQPRRHLLRAGVGLAVAGALAMWARPAIQGAAHDGYFSALAQALRRSPQPAHAAAPIIVIDKQRLQHNARTLRDMLHAQSGGALQLRLVNKSLPSMELLDLLMQITGTQRQMVFNLPYLLQLAQQRPQVDILLGKPLPASAATAFYQQLPADTAFVPHQQLQWLIDTPQRMQEYRDLARALQQPLRVNLEIDVGLHRGGFDSHEALAAALEIIRSEPLLHFAGMMGYDPHISKIPDLPGARAQALSHARQVYDSLRQQALETLPGLRGQAAQLTWNAAGSPTFHLHNGRGAANEVAIGSAFVKPSDFDLPHLETLQPAVFIATPVLKSSRFALPTGVQAIGAAVRWWDRNQQQGYFVHGGNWLAQPVSPAGLQVSSLYGRSSNQELYVGSGRQQLAVGDTIFLRPTQSEAVLQQFGAIAVVDGAQAPAHWSVFPAFA